MADTFIHALILIQNWGNDSELVKILVGNKHVISLFHVTGRHSYLLDANFDDKHQLEKWIYHLKSTKLSSGVPAILSMQTQRIIEVHKQKTGFSLQNYLDMKEPYHFFLKIDAPQYSEDIIKLLSDQQAVYSLLHVQGENTFTVEVIVSDYGQYRSLLNQVKTMKSIAHIETQEVLSVIKYRNHVMDDGVILKSGDDHREMYTL